MKKCPFCAEDIQDAAIVCKHCGRDLSGGGGETVQKIRIVPRTSPVTWLVAGLFALAIGGRAVTFSMSWYPTSARSLC